MREGKEQIFRAVVLSQIPRILGYCDRNPASPLQGCFDRLYWNYRITDFPSIWMQDGCFLLALLYTKNFNGNMFYGEKMVLEWAKKSVDFWARALHPDGSGDEMYPYERSFCATAFSACAVTEALLLIDAPIPPILEKTAKWLAGQDNSQAANQRAAAALAIYNVAQLKRNRQIEQAADKMAFSLLGNQSAEGFFVEYGGYDIGYLSITLSLLARLHRKTQDEKLRIAAEHAIAFLDDKIHDDGTYDNSRCSRKTQYLYPFGLAYFSNSILDRIVYGLEHNRIVNPSWLDDRYIIPMTIDYLQTYLYTIGSDWR